MSTLNTLDNFSIGIYYSDVNDDEIIKALGV